MPVTNYYTVNGQIIGESTGGVRTSYMVDPLGSVIGTIDEGGSVVNTYRYKPYGALLAKTGSGADPANTWVGAWGYRQTGKRYSDAYVRARHYGSLTATWTATDPLWPQQPSYTYASANPSTVYDHTGLKPCRNCCCCATGFSVTNIKPLDGIDRYGHSFKVSMSTEWSGDGSNEDCSLQWLERNSAPFKGVPPDVWVDLANAGSITLIPWSKRKKQCGKADNVFITDEPSVGLKRQSGQDTGFRCLCIRIILKSGKDCGCNKTFSQTWYQYLEIANGKGVKRFFVPDLFPTYCKTGKCQSE